MHCCAVTWTLSTPGVVFFRAINLFGFPFLPALMLFDQRARPGPDCQVDGSTLLPVARRKRWPANWTKSPACFQEIWPQRLIDCVSPGNGGGISIQMALQVHAEYQLHALPGTDSTSARISLPPIGTRPGTLEMITTKTIQEGLASQPSPLLALCTTKTPPS